MASTSSQTCLVSFDEQQKLPNAIRNHLYEAFEQLSSCVTFIEQQTKEDKAVIVITTSIDEKVLQTLELLIAIEGILIFSPTEKDAETLPSKVVGVYSQAEPLLRTLSQLLDTIEIQLIIKSFLLSRDQDGNENLHFYFYHLWKHSSAKDSTSTKKSLADHSRLLFSSNNQIKGAINDFESTYKSHDILSWFNQHRHPFPYHSLLFNALRRHNQEILSLARFFVHDMNKQMKPAPSGQVYLGTRLPWTVIEELEQQTKNDAVIAFQCYLLVTQSRAEALLEGTRPSCRQKMTNVLFKIDLNHVPCATHDETVYIDVGTPFRVSCVTRSAGASSGQQLLTIVKLTALSQHEQEQFFGEFMRKQQKLGRTNEYLLRRMASGLSDDEALADEHLARSEWTEAATIFARIDKPSIRALNKYGCLLREHLNDLDGALRCHQQALMKAKHREKAETLMYLGLVYNNTHKPMEAFEVFSQALQWFEKEKKPDLPLIARCLVGMGNAQRENNELDDALDYAERALAIREYQITPKNDFDIAACLGNIGNILYDKGEIQRALTYATRAVELLSTCAKDDGRLAAALNNLGALHESIGNYEQAREYFQRALNSLPEENHAYRKSTLANLAQLDLMESSEQ